jgi:hypothetical protein
MPPRVSILQTAPIIICSFVSLYSAQPRPHDSTLPVAAPWPAEVRSTCRRILCEMCDHGLSTHAKHTSAQPMFASLMIYPQIVPMYL